MTLSEVTTSLVLPLESHITGIFNWTVASSRECLLVIDVFRGASIERDLSGHTIRWCVPPERGDTNWEGICRLVHV